MLLLSMLAPEEQFPKCPAGGRSPCRDHFSNQYITRDDVRTDPVIVPYLGHDLLHHRATWYNC